MCTAINVVGKRPKYPHDKERDRSRELAAEMYLKRKKGVLEEKKGVLEGEKMKYFGTKFNYFGTE